MRFHISDDRVDIAQHCHRLGPLAFISPVRILLRALRECRTNNAQSRGVGNDQLVYWLMFWGPRASRSWYALADHDAEVVAGGCRAEGQVVLNASAVIHCVLRGLVRGSVR